MTDKQNTEKDEVEGQGIRHGDKSEVEGQGVRHGDKSEVEGQVMKVKEPAEVAGQGIRHGMTDDADASEDKATESQGEKADEPEPEVEGQGIYRG